MRKQIVLLAAVAFAVSACSDGNTGTSPIIGTTSFSSGVSEGGVVPTLVQGNIAGEGPQVCMNVNVNPEGAEWLGFKIDPPVSGSQFGITYTLSGSEDQYLQWSAINSVTVHAVVVKGGPDQNIYHYNPDPSQGDAGLHSPNNPGGNVPAISHFTFCYTVDPVEDEGCTPGYWKNRAITTGDWNLTPYTPSQALNTVFTFPANAVSPLGSSTMHQALDFGGGNGVLGGARIMLRAAAAAALNAAHDDVNYGMTSAQVIAAVNAALVKGSDNDTQWRARMIALGGELDALNNAGCPLGAMR